MLVLSAEQVAGELGGPMVSAAVMLYIPGHKAVSSVKWEVQMVTIHSGHLPRSETVFLRRGGMHKKR